MLEAQRQNWIGWAKRQSSLNEKRVKVKGDITEVSHVLVSKFEQMPSIRRYHLSLYETLRSERPTNPDHCSPSLA